MVIRIIPLSPIQASMLVIAGAILCGCSLDYNATTDQREPFSAWGEPANQAKAPVVDGQTKSESGTAQNDSSAAKNSKFAAASKTGGEWPTWTGSPTMNSGTNAAFEADGPDHGVETPSEATMATRARSPLDPLLLYGQLPQATLPPGATDSPDNLRQVTFSTEGADFDPCIDPAGSQIIFASSRHRQTFDIFAQGIGKSAITQLTDDPANDVMPTFSPDGKRIAFASDRTGNWDIYIMDANGGKAVQLTTGPEHELHPSFSPDGKQIIFSTFNSKSGEWELVLIDVANPASRRFIGPGLFPAWSPASNTIVFQRARERGGRLFGIWTIDLVDGQAVRPTQVAASANAALINPAWSPDGKHIVFSAVVNPPADGTPRPVAASQAKPVQADLWMINSDGSGRTNLTRSTLANLQPVWGRDGSVYFVSNRDKGSAENIWSLNPRQAVEIAAPSMGPSPLMRSGEKTPAAAAMPEMHEPPARSAEVPTGP